MANFRRQSMLGTQNNHPEIDQGTNALTQTQPPGFVRENSAESKARPKVLLRLPTLEIFAFFSSALFATHKTPLTEEEKKAAKEVFGDSIDLEVVRIIVSPIAAAPTTLGNHIRSSSTVISRSILIHELAHIWQFQTKGLRYISDSVFHQTKAELIAGSRNHAYFYKIVEGQSIHSYTAEHQAAIIEDFFSDQCRHRVPRRTWPRPRKDPEYLRLIDEVRKSRPLPKMTARKIILAESWIGPAFGYRSNLSATRHFKVKGEPGIPLLRIEF